MSTRASSLLVVAGLLLVVAAMPVYAADGAAASEVVTRINNARAAQGLPALDVYSDRSEVVRANEARISSGKAHSTDSGPWYFGSGANRYGETQANGPGLAPKGAVDLWRRSSGHAAIMFDEQHTHVVASVITSGDRTYYTAQFVTIPGSSGASAAGSSGASSGESSGGSSAESSGASASGSGSGDSSGAADTSPPEPAPEPEPTPAPPEEPPEPLVDLDAVFAELQLAVLEDRHGPVSLDVLADVVVESETESLPAAWPGDAVDRGHVAPAPAPAAPVRPALLERAAAASPPPADPVIVAGPASSERIPAGRPLLPAAVGVLTVLSLGLFWARPRALRVATSQTRR